MKQTILILTLLLPSLSSGQECYSNTDCEDDFACIPQYGECSLENESGLCADQIDCPAVPNPVCGCNGINYMDICEAALAGTGVAHLGYCETENTECYTNEDCDQWDTCYPENIGDCDNELGGDCILVGDDTDWPCYEENWLNQPQVCGCDGFTYLNECEAMSLGRPIEYYGECGAPIDICYSNDDCEAGYACIPPASDCDFTTGPGECIEQGGGCFNDYVPVCGCDGVTYSNECYANILNGMGIAYEGECEIECEFDICVEENTGDQITFEESLIDQHFSNENYTWVFETVEDTIWIRNSGMCGDECGYSYELALLHQDLELPEFLWFKFFENELGGEQNVDSLINGIIAIQDWQYTELMTGRVVGEMASGDEFSLPFWAENLFTGSCFSNEDCNEDYICVPQNGECGFDNTPGSCFYNGSDYSIPCHLFGFEEVCTCGNNWTAENWCVALTIFNDFVAYEGECEPPCDDDICVNWYDGESITEEDALNDFGFGSTPWSYTVNQDTISLTQSIFGFEGVDELELILKDNGENELPEFTEFTIFGYWTMPYNEYTIEMDSGLVELQDWDFGSLHSGKVTNFETGQEYYFWTEAPQIGDECEIGAEILGYIDCSGGNCVPAENIDSYIGNNICDDGASVIEFPADLNCPEFGFDCGECYPPWEGWDPLDFCDNYMPIDIGDECLIGDGTSGIINCFYQCTGGTWLEIIGEGGCEEIGQHPWDCEEYGWDCGDCNPDWDGTDPLGFCGEDYNGPIWHISTDGSDETGDGSAENPFATILHGIDAAADGDTIQIGEGTFFENVVIEENHPQTLSIIGSGMFSTIVDGQENGGVFRHYESLDYLNYLFKDLAVINGNLGGIFIHGNTVDLSIENVWFDNNSGGLGGGIDFSGYFYSANCEDIPVDYHSFFEVKNSLFTNNHSGFGTAIHVNSGMNINIDNCTFANNGLEDNPATIEFDYTCDIAINNSIFWHNLNDYAELNLGAFTDVVSVTYSLIEGGEDEIEPSWIDVEISNILDTTPLFTNPENGDFTLQPNSPCIDAGDPESTLDPDGTIADMGAFYFDQTMDMPPITLSLADPNYDDLTINVLIEASETINALELTVTGLSITNVTSDMIPVDWSITLDEASNILLFDLGGEYLANPQGILLTLHFDMITADEICIASSLASFDGNSFDVETGACFAVLPQHFTPLLGGFEPEVDFIFDNAESENWGWFDSSSYRVPVVINEIHSVDIGDEIGLQDSAGVTEMGDCPGTTGPVLTGAAVYKGGPLEIMTTRSIEICNWGGYDEVYPGWIEGNNMVIRIWDRSEDRVYYAEPSFIFGDGTWRTDSMVIDVLMPLAVEDAVKIPNQFSLEKPYPNPFNPETVIAFTVPVRSVAEVSVLDIQGRQVQTLVNGRVEAGRHELTWNAENQPAGVYFIRLSVGEMQLSRKVVLLK